MTEPLLRSDVIDYLLTQDLKRLLRKAVENLKAAQEGTAVPAQVITPIEIYCRYSLGTG